MSPVGVGEDVGGRCGHAVAEGRRGAHIGHVVVVAVRVTGEQRGRKRARRVASQRDRGRRADQDASRWSEQRETNGLERRCKGDQKSKSSESKRAQQQIVNASSNANNAQQRNRSERSEIVSQFTSCQQPAISCTLLAASATAKTAITPPSGNGH